MPLHYAQGTLAEHLTCRDDAVVFDVSHLGTVRLRGPQAFDQLQHALTNDLRKIAPGRAQYTHLCNESGGVIDDIIVWWVSEDEFDVMPNASNTTGVLSAIDGDDVTSTRCVLAVQGPAARTRLAAVNSEFATVPRFAVREVSWRGHAVRIAGTGYTGEDGIEISIPNSGAEDLLRELVAAGITPAGLGARDTLRLEAALPLHGHELSPSITTLEARLGWVVGWDKDDFRGREALVAQKADGCSRLAFAVATDSRQPLRDGAVVRRNGVECGVLTSGNFSPVLGHGIGLGLGDPTLAVGDAVTIVLRGREIPGTVVPAPFIRKAK
jgi:aminomethyltransferase